MRAGVKPLGAFILVLVHVFFSRADLFEAIPKRRVMAEVKAVKVERSRARGHVASNTLTAFDRSHILAAAQLLQRDGFFFLRAFRNFLGKNVFPAGESRA
jgi:hypothetical protein